MRQRVFAWVAVVLTAIAAIYGVGWLVWKVVLLVPPNAARIWALAATALLPVVSWASWWFGNTEARGRLAGIDQAVDKVMSAATRAAGLRVGTARAMHAPSPPAPTIAMELPPPEVVYLPPSRGRIVEL